MTGGKPDCPAAVSKSQAWRGKPPCQSTNHYKHFGPLGVEVNLASQEFRVYLSTLQSDPPHMYRLTWGADYPDANNWLNDAFHSAAPTNFGGFASAEFDSIVESAAREQDQQRRTELYKRAEEILVEEVAAIAPIYHQTRVNVTKLNVQRTFAPFGGEQLMTWKAFSPNRENN